MVTDEMCQIHMYLDLTLFLTLTLNKKVEILNAYKQAWVNTTSALSAGQRGQSTLLASTSSALSATRRGS